MYTVHPNTLALSPNVYTSFGYPNRLIQFHSNRAILWQFNVAGNNETYLGLHVICAICLTDFK
jgi:hypothetical protein